MATSKQKGDSGVTLFMFRVTQLYFKECESVVPCPKFKSIIFKEWGLGHCNCFKTSHFQVLLQYYQTILWRAISEIEKK